MCSYSNTPPESFADGHECPTAIPGWYSQGEASTPASTLEEIKWAWEGLPPSPDDETDSADGCPAWYPPGYVEGVRLSDELPGPFQRYMERFVRYFPKKCYHVKRCYDGTWPQKKIKKGPRAGKPAVLYDDGENKILTEMIERHLDYHQWMAWKDWDKVAARPHSLPQLWLALNAPKYLNHENIDIDSKRVLGYYRQGASDHSPLRPVMYLPLEHFQNVKAIYDAFPGRIWCISSESLGLHAWKWYHRLEPLQQRRLPILNRLEAIGYAGTEVHPMPGRPQRRPFGKDYRTITADGVLTNWVDQLGYFENPGPTPTFKIIANVLLNAMIRQWRSWLVYRDAKSDKVHPAQVLGQHLHEVREVRAWLTAGCPDVPSTVPLTSGTKPGPPTSRFGKKTARPARSTIDMDAICKTGKWVQTCETWAKDGLPHEDSIYQVAAELAKWLYWVEMHHLPPEKRQDHVHKLLVQFVERKHNGMCDRLIQGRRRNVVQQLGRIVQKVVDHGDVKPWQEMRRKRADGEYQ